MRCLNTSSVFNVFCTELYYLLIVFFARSFMCVCVCVCVCVCLFVRFVGMSSVTLSVCLKLDKMYSFARNQSLCICVDVTIARVCV